jgi:protein-S-isoprenylcysteine O-methyltransferase Ste14
MQALELKLPPLLLAPLLALAMWGLSHCEPHFTMPDITRYSSALLILLAGGSVTALGALTFRTFKTTLDPTRPHRASSFVTSGVYRFTRNPMYLGLAMILVAWAIMLAALWPFAGPVFWVLYMNRFQIKPEERILAGMFGEEYSRYLASVRRWL